VAKLEILSGKGSGNDFDLEQFSGKDKIVLGNRRTAAVQVRDPWVSFVHAEILQEEGRYLICDRRSKAGTFVNGDKVGKHGTTLKHGDTISLGKTQIRFVDESATKKKSKKKKKKKKKSSQPAGQPAGEPESAPVAPGIGGMTPHAAGPFTPVVESTGDVSQLSADLRRARSEAEGLRKALAARERALSEAQTRASGMGEVDPEAVQALEERVRVAEERTGQAMAAYEDTKSKALIRIEELTRLNQVLESRIGGGGAPLVHIERQLAAAREELRQTQGQARRRIEELSAQVEEGGGGGADPAELQAAQAATAAAEKRAEDAEAALDKVEDQVGAVQSAKREVDILVEDLRKQLDEASSKGGDEVGALEQAISELNEDLQAALAERREALQALQEKDAQLAMSLSKSTGRINPAQISSLRNRLSDMEDALAARDKELEASRNEAEVAKMALEAVEGEGAEAGLRASVAKLETQLSDSEQARKAAEDRAQAAASELEQANANAATAPAAAATPAPAAAAAAAGGGASVAEVEALKSRITDLEEESASLLRDLEEINEDMLAQEEEYQERIQELEAKVGG
jgi:pSer/pThr/pTyr-binding forkhead associated (FHA) protein